MKTIFDPSWISSLDQSLVTFLNEFFLNWVCAKCKPRPFGNEYHSIACCISKIIFHIELVKTKKEQPKEGKCSKPELEYANDCCSLLWSHENHLGFQLELCVWFWIDYTVTLPELEKRKFLAPLISRRQVLVGQQVQMLGLSLPTCTEKCGVSKSVEGFKQEVPSDKSLACCSGRQQAYLNHGKHMVDNPSKGKEEVPCRVRVDGGQ